MLSIRRLSYILILVFCVSAIFMAYNINEERAKHVNISHEKVEERELKDPLPIETVNRIDKEQYTYYVFGDSERDIYKDIFENVSRQLSDWKLSYTAESTPFFTKNLSENAIIIFCDDAISEYCDLKDLGDYISKGGRVIFAAGLPEGDADSYLNAYWGIAEKAGRANYNEWTMMEEFLPLQIQDLKYDGYSLSSKINVRDETTVYMGAKDTKVPLIYTSEYEKGISCIFNGTFLSDASCTGFLAGAIGILQEEFMYPVFGTKSVFLDNFPMITYVNDKASLKLYGRNTESFVRDIVWPMFQGISLRNNVPYTSSVLTVASDEKSFPEISKGLFSTIGKSALQFDGELTYAVNTISPEKIYLNEKVIKDFEEVFQQYTIRGITMVSDDMNYDVLKQFGNEGLAVRGRLDADNKKLRVSWDENNFTFPGATYGNNMESGNFAEILSVLTAYGTISHTFDINLMIAENDETASWNTYKKQLAEFETKILSQTEYLEGKTLSQLVNQVKSYENLEFCWNKEGNKLFLYTGTFVEGQTFFYHTKQKVVGAKGADYSEIGNGYYMIKVQEPQVVLELEGQ